MSLKYAGQLQRLLSRPKVRLELQRPTSASALDAELEIPKRTLGRDSNRCS